MSAVGETMQPARWSCRYRLARGAFELDAKLAPATQLTGVFGSSGAGKTTLLRCIAGLESGASGALVLGDREFSDGQRLRSPAHVRRVGYVTQDPKLFNHLSVRGNLLYGARRHRSGPGGVAFDVLVTLLGLESLLDRRPGGLSGGERQRVAIGRALLSAPQLLLLDEPLANVDHGRREPILAFLARLPELFALPVLYVSHSLAELCAVCDELVVLEAGQVRSSGALTDVLADVGQGAIPGEEAGVVIDAHCERYDSEYALSYARFAGGEFVLPGEHPLGSMRLRVLAHDVSISRDRAMESSILNIVPARLEAIGAGAGPHTLLRLRCGDTPLLARITRRSLVRLDLSPGDAVYAQIKALAVRRVSA